MSDYTLDDRRSLRREMANAITGRVRNPAGWLLAVRAIVEAVGMDPARCIPLGDGALDRVCFEVVSYAEKFGVTPEALRVAFVTAVPAREPAD